MPEAKLNNQSKKKKENKECITGNIKTDIARFQEIFKDCADIKMRQMFLGQEKNIECLVAYIEVAVANVLFEKSALGKLLNSFCGMEAEKLYDCLEKKRAWIVGCVGI